MTVTSWVTWRRASKTRDQVGGGAVSLGHSSAATPLQSRNLWVCRGQCTGVTHVARCHLRRSDSRGVTWEGGVCVFVWVSARVPIRWPAARLGGWRRRRGTQRRGWQHVNTRMFLQRNRSSHAVTACQTWGCSWHCPARRRLPLRCASPSPRPLVPSPESHPAPAHQMSSVPRSAAVGLSLMSHALAEAHA